ncbi:MAG: DUF255 domain-containing protein [Polyangiaceae bacterium]
MHRVPSRVPPPSWPRSRALACVATFATFAVSACANAGSNPGPRTAATPKPDVPALMALSGAPKDELPWATFDDKTFAKAKAERRFVILDGAAEWCHWCHVMEATTYHDEAVREVLAKSFIATKVDVDTRPDIEERYNAWGWPATVIFSPDGEELGKYKGYIGPEDFVAILTQVAATRDQPAKASGTVATKRVPVLPISADALDIVHRFTKLELEDYWDEEEGGWGHKQKAPMMWNNEWLLANAKAGDALAKKRVLFTLGKQRAILDPVWGGIYQYSAATNWNEPHFEKLMTWQAGALDNYASAYALTKDPQWLAVAKGIAGYVEGFMTSREGGFFTTQDADLNAHDRTKPYMTGHEYYAKGDAERRALGLPRVDDHEYGRENGLAIAAFATFHQATGDAHALEVATRAADRILATHRTKSGTITHDVATAGTDVVYLADNAAMAWGLLRLHDVTSDAKWLTAAAALLDATTKALADETGGGWFGSTEDPNAVGIFKVRRKPFEENVMALRATVKLATKRPSPDAKRVALRALTSIAAPEDVRNRGRMVGDLLVAIEEFRALP